LFYKRQERYITRPFDGPCQFSLVFGAVAGHSARQHLAPVGNITPQDLDIFIINKIYFVYTESAELSSLKSFIVTQFINSFLSYYSCFV